MKEKISRIDADSLLRKSLMKHCRLSAGQVWEDKVSGHRVGCIDAADFNSICKLMNGHSAVLALHDPPYNVAVGNANTEALGRQSVDKFIAWCRQWIENTSQVMSKNSSLYIWLGADQNQGFQPLPDFMMMMREFDDFKSRSFITMRNQRGYGTQKNWMAVRQELLYYTKGAPEFYIEAEYTDIPKILKGYYKKVGGKITDNMERSHSDTIRAGNVWVDVQQVFYRMHENVAGCYAQKPLKAIERIIRSATKTGEHVCDFFAHSGTTLIACEKLQRRCFICDIDPVFAEISIRRLENYRKTGKEGFQNNDPFQELLK